MAYIERGEGLGVAPLPFFAEERNRSYISKPRLRGDLLEALGAKLQRCRLRNGWSKRVVAKKLGVSIPSIIRWEEGAVEPNDYNRYKIEQLLTTAGVIVSSRTTNRGIQQLGLFGGGELGESE